MRSGRRSRLFPRVLMLKLGGGEVSSPVCDSVKKRSSEGLEEVRMEVEEREKIHEELHSVQLQLEAADVLLTELEQGRSTQELQVRRLQRPKSLPVERVC